MQIVSKIEPSSPLSTTSSIITPKSSKDLMQAITKRLLSGKESANQLRNLYIKRLGLKVEENDDDDDNTNKNNFDDQHLFYHHLGVTLNSFDACISLIKSHDFDQQEIMNKKRKVDDQNIDDDDHSSKSQDTFDANKVSKERRGCYKRRKTGQSWSIEATTLTDDGHAWRKYGQKEILHTKYPRNYYRCTHKHEQNCQATKQVQQISEDPTKYNIIYNGQHTCKNLHKTPSLIIDDPQEQNPSFFLSFGSNNYPTSKHALNPPMFPSTTFHNNNTSTTTTTTTTTTFVKEESSPPMVAPNDHDHDHGTHKQYPSSPSSSDNNHPSSSSLSYDVTSTRLSSSLASTPVSEQSDVISPPEFYSSTPSQYEIMDEEVFLGILNMKQDYFYPHLDELLND